MTEAPERIWALADRRKHWAAEPFTGDNASHMVEYVRKDVADLARPVTVAEAAKIAERIERHGVDHDRAMSGWGVPDNCIVVFQGGNITSYVPTTARALSHEGGE